MQDLENGTGSNRVEIIRIIGPSGNEEDTFRIVPREQSDNAKDESNYLESKLPDLCSVEEKQEVHVNNGNGDAADIKTAEWTEESVGKCLETSSWVKQNEAWNEECSTLPRNGKYLDGAAKFSEGFATSVIRVAVLDVILTQRLQKENEETKLSETVEENGKVEPIDNQEYSSLQITKIQDFAGSILTKLFQQSLEHISHNTKEGAFQQVGVATKMADIITE